MSVCHYCGTSDDLRPYGPGGAPICFDCMKSSPEREEAAKAAYGALLNASAVIGSGVVTIGTAEGPIPFDPAAAGSPETGSEQ